MKRILFFISIMTLLGSCGPQDQVKFKETQPANVKESSGFHSLRRGNYVNYRNSKNKLHIYKTYITLSSEFQYSEDRNKIEISKLSKVVRSNDSAMTAYFNQFGADVKIENDTVYISKIVTDTMFIIGSKNILKHYKRSYYLNYQTDDSLWKVYRIKFKNDSLLYGEITPSDTLLSYSYTQIDTLSKDTLTKNYILNPDKRELRELMRSNAFKVTEKYIKE